MEPVITISALGDNYIYLYRYHRNNAFAVDPGEAGAVLEALEKHGLNLTDVLITHRHFDHTGGVGDLKDKTGCNVISGEQAEVLLDGNVKIQVTATPGHTRDSVCYYVQPTEEHSGLLFTGDTLFVGGCGRPIECDARTLWQSLRKLAALPNDTLVFPGHDYTQENYEFALTIVPDNPEVKSRLDEIKKIQRQGLPTVPSTILQEKTTNVFLNANKPEIKAALNMSNAADADVFTELRRKKNIFG
ncbi:MAG: hydroxyacylglutathione hydrolase [Phycisphaerae bacterium]|nr:hydroxyacylglutathione hydrolase [Phycisphaerae bacterium]NIR67168.1 hydroxyacylglutathione hydrolase [candidate division Zixibacteria bacterium]NIP53622.1 hydroxyacylglutathione hydrolase [Phycisphaerae bacterium]NIS51892.1 hydroxyacylglutathione hydrolase [Phycisphaerae bacterium]NIU09403.1 hydroxyacylglutathione hydrolase [Phycisphaerae bacterium]